jgi:molybdenum cofactor biosynthesis protein B
MGGVTARSRSRAGAGTVRPARPARGVAERARRPAHAAPASRAIGCAILTVSDSRRGQDDASGQAIAERLESAGHRVLVRAWVPDAPAAIRRAAGLALERDDVAALLVTGGTGIAPRDRTPEALEPLVERWLPGFGERFRALSESQVGSAAWLSRAGAAIARGRLLVLLPGSTRAVVLALDRLLIPELGHVVRLLGRNP